MTQTVPYGESATLNANSFTRTGYTFSGWNTNADGSGTAYGDGASISPSSNVTLYAQWAMAADYTVLLPDGDNITVDPETKIGSAQIGIQAGSVMNCATSSRSMCMNASVQRSGRSRSRPDWSRRREFSPVAGRSVLMISLSAKTSCEKKIVWSFL